MTIGGALLKGYNESLAFARKPGKKKRKLKEVVRSVNYYGS